MINLYCIRHGEAIHNILYKQQGMKIFFDKEFYDTKLTNLGHNQAIELGKTWTDKNKIELVIVSPLTRTLQTAQNIFKGMNIKMIAFENVKEYPQGKHTCNRRSKLSSLKKYFPEIDFTNIITEEDTLWDPDNIESIDSLLARINQMYDFIETTKYKNIALVGHNGFISMMKYGKFLYNEDGEQELKHCYPYIIKLKFDKKSDII